MHDTLIRFPNNCQNAPAASRLALECLIYWAEDEAPLALAESAWDTITSEADENACWAASKIIADALIGVHTTDDGYETATARDYALTIDFTRAGFPVSVEVIPSLTLASMETADIQPTIVG